jgi:hypothetical protein
MSHRFLALSLILFTTFTLSGCSWTYLTVKSDVANSTIASPGSDIVQTSDYLKRFENVKKVAFRAPDSCVQSLESNSTGSAINKQLVSARCGVVMAELEKALVKAGYDVYSWKSINGLVYNNSEATYVDAAKKLGAEILFEVNSLEQKTIPTQSKFNRKYLESNSRGKIIGDIAISEDELKQINKLVTENEQANAYRIRRVGAMIDINAVDVTNSKKIWFYQWSKPSRESLGATMNTYFAGRGGKWKLWTPSGINSKETNSTADGASSTTQKEAVDAIYFRLVREVINDFINAFSSGRA